MDGGERLHDERCSLPGRTWDRRSRRDGRGSRQSVAADLQQYAYRGHEYQSAVGRAISEPLDYRWRRRNVRRYLDSQHIRASGAVRLEYFDGRAHLRTVQRASRAERGDAAQRFELADLCT